MTMHRPDGAAAVTRGRPRVIAHRGASAIAPENTLPAFRLAVEVGAAMIETDVRLTRDGQAVLIHDDELARTTNCRGAVSAARVADLAACDAGYWFTRDDGRSYPYRGQGLRLPTISELFESIDHVSPGIVVNLEIKHSPDDSDIDSTRRIVDELVQQLDDNGLTRRVLISSFSARVIDRVISTSRPIRTALICGRDVDLRVMAELAAARGYDALHPHHAALRVADVARQAVAMLHAAGLEVNVWTVNDPTRMRQLAAVGVDGIMSDDPARLREVIEASVSD